MAETAWDFVAIGAGAAGNGAVRIAGKLGFRTALIENDRVGGACSWTACVPSKALLQAARIHWNLLHGQRAGISLQSAQIDPSGALEWVREITNRLGGGDRSEKLKERGIQLLRGTGVFEDKESVRVGDRILPARRMLISTGSRPAVPEIEGLDRTNCLTNLTLFDLPEPPRSMIIVGAGPMGMEMAQAFNRLGTDVTVIERDKHVLTRCDAELGDLLRQHLEEEGVTFFFETEVRRVDQRQGGERRVTAVVDGQERIFAAEELLIAAGREAQVDALGLEKAGVTGDADAGIEVNDRLQTSNPNIYAAGDVLRRWQFTHMATIEGGHVAHNALLGADEPMDYSAAGWCMFTEPEFATVGFREAQAQEQGLDFEVYRIDPAIPDRAQIEGRPDGAVKVIAEPGGGRIFGAQILAARAGEIIQEFSAAVRHGIPFSALAEDVHVYPTLSIAHYEVGQMDWQQLAQDPERLEQIRREPGFTGQ